MADDADIATAINDRALEKALAARRGDLTHGEPGECRDCEHHSPRLVRGRCAFCRDGRVRS